MTQREHRIVRGQTAPKVEGETIQFWGKCKGCGDFSGFLDRPNEVDEWKDRHDFLVSSARSWDKTRTNTKLVPADADWYREQSEDRTNSESDRAMWKQLADEADKRLGRVPSRWTDEQPLPFD